MVKKVSIWLTLEPLIYSGSLHLAEISKRLRKSHTTVRKQLQVFERIGLIKKEKIGRQTFYKIKNTPLLIDYLTIIEKERLIDKSNKELLLKAIVEFLHNFNNPILIFGSAVDSLRNANDIDLLIVGRYEREELKKIERRMNIRLHVINVDSLEEISEALKEEVKKKHLIVQGSEELIKWLIS